MSNTFSKLGQSLIGAANSAAGISNGGIGLNGQVPIGSGAASYDSLGAFANTVDKSAQRSYVESGLINGVRPRAMALMSQSPDMTVVIKKRQFSSLAENYRYDLMDNDEKLFVKASKRLFYNKCKAIAAYEQLTKIENIVVNGGGAINDFLLPAIFTATDALNTFAPGLLSGATQSALDTIRKVKAFGDPSKHTTWITDPNPTNSALGEGTGVFELTTVSSASCNNVVKFMGGKGHLSIEDPYKLMIITLNNIDQAINEASQAFSQNAFFKLTSETLNKELSILKTQLSEIRASRGAPNVIISINESSLLFRKVRAVIDRVGTEINFTYDGGVLGIGASITLDDSATTAPYGLINQEADIFKQVIQNIYAIIALQHTLNQQTVSHNKNTNYVRQRMRLEFGNKPIIQPMDVVHIFVTSKTLSDFGINQGLNLAFAPIKSGDSGINLFGGLNKAINSVLSPIRGLLSSVVGAGSADASYMEVEKDSIAGADFPMWLWQLMRNDFTRQSAGTHIFAGIVRDSSHSYSAASGKYELGINLEDQSHYFNYSNINKQPSLDVYNGALYDPLTPFKLTFDASSGLLKGEFPPLLDENVKLLGSGSIKSKNGRFRGSILDQSAYSLTEAEKMSANFFRTKFNDPDGFVYRWKQGIGAITLSGEAHNPATFINETSPALTSNPFAGQDVMNVLSLLITGQPYNFNTFLQAALASATLSKESLTNQAGAVSYFKGLVNDLNKSNQIWGSFIPFKKMTVSDSAYQFLLTGQIDLTASNRIATDLLQQRAKRFDALTAIMPSIAQNGPQFYKGLNNSITINTTLSANSDLKSSISTLASDIIKLDQQLDSQTKSILNSLGNANTGSGALKIFGDDISYDQSFTGGSSITSGGNLSERNSLRQNLNNLTQRRLWKVKANQDNNLFIVDDSYDKNYDIQAFEKGLAGKFDTFVSTYTTIKENIESTATLLGLEVFADSQGHMQARAPQYNKMPSSVFYKMLQDKATKGIQLFPDFLESLFINQIDGLVSQLEADEDQIRIRAAALGYVTDDSAKNLLRGGVSGSGALSNIGFSFCTDETSGKIGGTDIRTMFTQASPDFMEDSTKQALDIVQSSIDSAVGANVNFDIIQRIQIINDSKTFAGIAPTSDINSRIAIIANRLQQNNQQPIPTVQSLLPHGLGDQKSQLDIFNLTQEIAQFISERQNVIKMLSNAVKNLDQGLTLNSSDNIGRNILYPSLNATGNDSIPKAIEHMIEDESFDDYGPNSGQRFVITDSNIISFTLVETPPDHTVVTVNGQLEGGLVQGPSGLETADGGNGISSASAVDYDMWRLYGFRGKQPASVSYLSDPENQCAPYAVFLLNQARKNIFTATCVCRGNEFMQAGEVYYIEDYNLLFYAESVQHTFTFGSTFTTTLNLTYGHNPGEYIPTQLDIIGKGLYANKHQANLIKHVRHGNANGDTSLAVIINDPSTFGSSGLNQLLAGAYGEQNRQILVNLSSTITSILATTSSTDQIYIEIRVYYNSGGQFSSPDSSLQSLANAVLSWIKNPSKMNNDNSSVIPDNSAPSGLDYTKVSVLSVDINTDNKDGNTQIRSSPSSQAWSAARNLASTGGTLITVSFPSTSSSTGPSIMQQQQSLFSNVIDIWAIRKSPQSNVNQVTSTQSTTNQASIAETQQYIDSFNKSIGLGVKQ